MLRIGIVAAALLLGCAQALRYDPCSDLKDASKVPTRRGRQHGAAAGRR
jgi:hypothetical protein